MKIAIGCDPNAQAAKEEVIAYIAKKGYGEVTDFGSEDPIYANVAIAVGEAVAAKRNPDLWNWNRCIYRSKQSPGCLCSAGIRCIFSSEGKTQQRCKYHVHGCIHHRKQRERTVRRCIPYQ